MTIIIKNSRQFNAVLAAAENSNEQITAMLSYAADQLYKHKNKDAIMRLYNSPAWRTKAGKVSAKGKPVLAYILSGQSVVMQLGLLNNGDVSPFNITNAPDKLSPNMIHSLIHSNAMAQGAELALSFDDFLSRNDDKEKPAPTDKPVKVGAFVKQLEAIIERGIQGDNADIDKASALLKQALNVLASAYVADDSATVLAADELGKVAPSAKSKSAGLKKVG